MMTENPIVSGSSGAAAPGSSDGASNTPYQKYNDNAASSPNNDTGYTLDMDVFTDDDWQQIRLLDEYTPQLNGTLNPDYIQLKAKIQNEIGVEAVLTENGKLKDVHATPYEFVKVPKEVIEARKERVLKYEQECLDRSRSNGVYILADNACEEIIKKHGEEIVFSLRTVAFLNAPQANDDLKGEGRLYLTKRTSRNGKITYRLFFYSYGESANYVADEDTRVVHRQWVEVFEHWTCFNLRSKYGLTSNYEHKVRRDVHAGFISLSLDDVLMAYHRVSDFTEIVNFINSENMFESELKLCDTNQCGLRQCYLDCKKVCAKECCCCCPSEFINEKHWRWTATEKLETELNGLVCRQEERTEKTPNAMVYDPYLKRNVATTSVLDKTTETRRFHTLNLTVMDSLYEGTKRRAVVVLDPTEFCANAIDLVCLLTNLTEEIRERKIAEMSSSLVKVSQPKDIESAGGAALYPAELLYRDWVLKLRAQNNDPFKNNRNIRPSARNLFDFLFGGLSIKVTIEWPYYYNVLVLIVFAFIGMIIGFAAAATNGDFAIDGIYSLVHLAYRGYKYNAKTYTTSMFYIDLGFAFLGLILAAAIASRNSSGSAASAFTVLQALLSFFGACYQFYKHLKDNGSGSIVPNYSLV